MATPVVDTDANLDQLDMEEYDLEEIDENSVVETLEDVSKYEQSKKFPVSIALPSGSSLIDVRKVLLLCNPHAGAQKGKRIGEKVKALFEQRDVMAILFFLDHAGHAEEICKTIELDDIDCICSIGGDGTFHEAINGILKREVRSNIPLAVIPAGTGNSFSVELQGGTNVRRAVNHILRGLVCPIDVVQVHFDNDPEKEDIYSINSMHWGLASDVNVTAEKLRWMGKAVRYTTAAFYEFMKGDKHKAKIDLELEDGKVLSYDEDFCMVIANNIQTAQKGMKLAPEAKLNDGLLDVLLIRSSGTFDLLDAFRKAYSGTHTDLDYIEYRKVKKLSITPYKEEGKHHDEVVQEELIDIDGELNGITPFTATVHKQRMNIII